MLDLSNPASHAALRNLVEGSDIGPVIVERADWWTDFQQVDPEDRDSLLLEEEKPKRTRRRRRR